MALKEKLDTIKELQKQIDTVDPFPEEIKKQINYKFRLEWNYHSNSMEGNTLTKRETRSVMIDNVTVEGKPARDVIEMRGHDNVVTELLNIGKGKARLSEKRIKAIHKAIIHEDDPAKKKLVGHWKTEPNEILNYRGEKFEFTAPQDVANEIHQLLNDTNTVLDQHFKGRDTEEHPVLVAFRFHLKYVTIHPFYDGNGRTARLLSNLLLIALGYPPLYIKIEEKDAYNRYLADIQAYGGQPDMFYEFLADKLIRSQQLVLDALAGKPIDEPDDIDKEISLWKRNLEPVQEEVVERSNSVVYELFTKSIEPVFQSIEKKVSENFGDLFKEISICTIINGQLQIAPISKIREDISDSVIAEKIAHTEGLKNEELQDKYSNLGLKINLKSFLRSEKSFFNASSDIQVYLQPLQYEIRIKSIQVLEKRYNVYLTNEEQHEIVKQFVSELFEFIRKKTGIDS